MPRRLTEQYTLLASVSKWTVYASVVGILTGASTALFLDALKWMTHVFTSVPSYFLLLPFTLLVSKLLVVWLAPDAEGHGTEKVIAAIHQRMGRIPLMVVPVKLVATVITLAGGGSAGKEGPAAQIGAGLSSAFASLVRMGDADRRKLAICGVSAGFAAIFGTPIAGSLFGLEVLFLGQILYEALFPSFVAGLTAFYVAHMLGATYFYGTIKALPAFNEGAMLKMIVLGAWCGLAAFLLIEGLDLAHRAFNSLPRNKVMAPLAGGMVLIAITLLVSPQYLGLGLDTIENGLNGGVLPWGSFFWKTVATSVTLGSGGSGGIVTPIFFIGTGAGNIFAQLIGSPNLALYSAVGMVALLAGAANTPISASVMAMEFFGNKIGPYAAIACIVSFLVVGHRSVYPSQILGMTKSASIGVETGGPIGEMCGIKFNTRPKSLTGIIEKAYCWARRRRK